MPSVYLSDEELADMVLERPEVLPMVIEKLRRELEDEQKLNGTLWKRVSELRARVKELEKGEEK